MSDERITAAASDLLAAQDEGQQVPQLTSSWPDLDVATAYLIQDEALRLRVERGETLVGIKLGLTSRAKQERMGIAEPLVAWLTDAMLCDDLTLVDPASLIHPRVEPEIAFVMGAPLAGPGVTTATAFAAVERVHAGVEMIDSRFEDFRFEAPDVIADNASSAAAVIGAEGVEPDAIDLSLEACLVEQDGQVVDSATGAAVLGHPAAALAWAANNLGQRGHRIDAGWIVLSGALTDAIPLGPGTRLGFHFTTLGSLDVAA